jgi:hypothetical protein
MQNSFPMTFEYDPETEKHSKKDTILQILIGYSSITLMFGLCTIGAIFLKR